MDRWDVVAVAALLVITWSVWSLGGWPGVIGFAAMLALAVAVGRHWAGHNGA